MPPNMDNLNSHQEIKKLLEQNQLLLVENNLLLKKIRRDEVLSRVFRLIWLGLIIGLSYYSYVKYLEPNMTFLMEQMETLQSLTPSSEKMNSFYEFFGNDAQKTK